VCYNLSLFICSNAVARAINELGVHVYLNINGCVAVCVTVCVCVCYSVCVARALNELGVHVFLNVNGCVEGSVAGMYVVGHIAVKLTVNTSMTCVLPVTRKVTFVHLFTLFVPLPSLHKRNIHSLCTLMCA